MESLHVKSVMREFLRSADSVHGVKRKEFKENSNDLSLTF